jgi:hypothetical protein
MPVAFTSNGYDTTATNPYSEGAWADAFPVIGQAKYAVRSPLDWKVTAVSGQDRTVSIAAGRGLGHGVTDKTVANDTIQLDTIESGSRWDMIACRRDWTPTAGESAFVKVNGGATATIPGGRQATPGNIDDQPLALVQVTAGQTQPTAIIDLRTWAGDGGGLVAKHDLVRSFLNTAGTRININGIDWIRRVGANDTNEWVQASRVVNGSLNAQTVISGLAAVTTNVNGDGSIAVPAGLSTVTNVILTDATTGLGAVILKWTAPSTPSPTVITFRAFGSNGSALPNYNLMVSWAMFGQA